MQTAQYIKSFSKGQITVPKSVRKALSLGDDFWLKVYTEAGKIIAEPVEKKRDVAILQKRLLSISGKWVETKELARNRKRMEKKIALRAL